MRGIDREFEQFAHAQTPRLLGLAYAMTGNRHDAWDLVQETLVRLGARWGRTRFTDPGAYARTTMVRLNIDRVRQLRREVPFRQPPERVRRANDAPDTSDWLLAALGGLSPRQRTALALRFVEDLDVRQIAERMGCSVGTAKSHLSRGLERLRAHAAAADETDQGRVGTRRAR